MNAIMARHEVRHPNCLIMLKLNVFQPPVQTRFAHEDIDNLFPSPIKILNSLSDYECLEASLEVEVPTP